MAFCPYCLHSFPDHFDECPNDGVPLAETALTRSADDSTIGALFAGRYRVVERIGAGGMAVVYRGWRTNPVQEVAVKLLNEHATQHDQVVGRFRREPELLSRLRHPNTMRVLECGETEDGRFYMVMEFLKGESLSARLTRGPLDPASALRILHQVAGALAEAHEHGIVHRDLKPGNVVLERVGGQEFAKVLDLGIAPRGAGDPHDEPRLGARNGGLHVAGAGCRLRDRTGQRPVRPGRRRLRVPRRTPPLRGRRHALHGPQARP